MELKYHQNEKKMKVGLLVTATTRSNLFFREKPHGWIEQYLFYFAIKKSVPMDVRKQRYNVVTENIR